jgi:hypothetical protein
LIEQPYQVANEAPPIVHIGYHKTATSWFQQQFFPHVTGGAFVPRDVARAALLEPDAFAFDASVARSALAPWLRHGRLLICEENFSGYLHNGGLGRLLSRDMANRIKAVLPTSEIVIMIRAQPAMVASTYAQYLRGGGTLSLTDYVYAQGRAKRAQKYWYKAPKFALAHFDYAALVEHYSELFGEAAVHVFAYEGFARTPADFISNFSARLGLHLDVEPDFSRRYESPGVRQLRMLRWLNRFTAHGVSEKHHWLNLQGWHKNRWKALRMLERLPILLTEKAGALAIPPELNAEMKTLFAPGNAHLADRFGLPLRELNYPMP